MHSGQGARPSTCSAYSAYPIKAAQARKPSALPTRRLMGAVIDSGSRVLVALRARLQVLFDFVDRQVPDVLAVHHVDDVFSHVLGVVADALQRARDPQHVERAAYRA